MGERMDKLKLIKELPDNKVEVEDTEGLRWIVGKEAYKRFKPTGFLYVSKELAANFQSLLGDKNFGSLTDHEKAEIIKKIISTAVGEPVENIFPHLSKLEDTKNG